MRKVLLKLYIPASYIDDDGNEQPKRKGNWPQKTGTGKWTDDFIGEGLFHCWGNESNDIGEHVTTDTVAIIEMPGGTVETFLPSKVKFSIPLAGVVVLADEPRIEANGKTIFIEKKPYIICKDGITFEEVCKLYFGDIDYDPTISCYYGHDSDKPGVVKTGGIIRAGNSLKVVEGMMMFSFHYNINK